MTKITWGTLVTYYDTLQEVLTPQHSWVILFVWLNKETWHSEEYRVWVSYSWKKYYTLIWYNDIKRVWESVVNTIVQESWSYDEMIDYIKTSMKSLGFKESNT